MLQEFELQRHRFRREAEIPEINAEQWRVADMRPDQTLGFGDAVRCDQRVQLHGQWSGRD